MKLRAAGHDLRVRNLIHKMSREREDDVFRYSTTRLSSALQYLQGFVYFGISVQETARRVFDVSPERHLANGGILEVLKHRDEIVGFIAVAMRDVNEEG